METMEKLKKIEFSLKKFLKSFFLCFASKPIVTLK